MPINAAWHAAHPMPTSASMTERIEWHREHAEECGCRPIPKSVQVAMRQSDATARRGGDRSR